MIEVILVYEKILQCFIIMGIQHRGLNSAAKPLRGNRELRWITSNDLQLSASLACLAGNLKADARAAADY